MDPTIRVRVYHEAHPCAKADIEPMDTPNWSMGIPSILCTSTNTTPNYLSSLLCKLPTEVRMSFGKLLLNV